jgi:hypothetical protein
MQDILLTRLCYETSGDAELSRELLIDSHLRYLNLMHHSKNTLQGIFGLSLLQILLAYASLAVTPA